MSEQLYSLAKCVDCGEEFALGGHHVCAKPGVYTLHTPGYAFYANIDRATIFAPEPVDPGPRITINHMQRLLDTVQKADADRVAKLSPFQRFIDEMVKHYLKQQEQLVLNSILYGMPPAFKVPSFDPVWPDKFYIDPPPISGYAASMAHNAKRGERFGSGVFYFDEPKLDLAEATIVTKTLITPVAMQAQSDPPCPDCGLAYSHAVGCPGPAKARTRAGQLVVWFAQRVDNFIAHNKRAPTSATCGRDIFDAIFPGAVAVAPPAGRISGAYLHSLGQFDLAFEPWCANGHIVLRSPGVVASDDYLGHYSPPPGGQPLGRFEALYEQSEPAKPRCTQHVAVGFGGKKGYCKVCDADMFFENLQWRAL